HIRSLALRRAGDCRASTTKSEARPSQCFGSPYFPLTGRGGRRVSGAVGEHGRSLSAESPPPTLACKPRLGTQTPKTPQSRGCHSISCGRSPRIPLARKGIVFRNTTAFRIVEAQVIGRVSVALPCCQPIESYGFA